MTNEELKQSLSALFPSVTYDETGEFLNAFIGAGEFHALMNSIRYEKGLSFDFLFCLTCIDWKTHLTMVYHLMSKAHRHVVVIKVKIDNINEPAIDTVTDIWKTAIFHEREVFDLFGVRFNKHPDMRRILLDDSWEGFPLRKNYVDENMIAI